MKIPFLNSGSGEHSRCATFAAGGGLEPRGAAAVYLDEQLFRAVMLRNQSNAAQSVRYLRNMAVHGSVLDASAVSTLFDVLDLAERYRQEPTPRAAEVLRVEYRKVSGRAWYRPYKDELDAALLLGYGLSELAESLIRLRRVHRQAGRLRARVRIRRTTAGFVSGQLERLSHLIANHAPPRLSLNAG